MILGVVRDLIGQRAALGSTFVGRGPCRQTFSTAVSFRKTFTAAVVFGLMFTVMVYMISAYRYSSMLKGNSLVEVISDAWLLLAIVVSGNPHTLSLWKTAGAWLFLSTMLIFFLFLIAGVFLHKVKASRASKPE